MIPREEEPQIVVPMLDVMTAMPGASPGEVENSASRSPLRRSCAKFPELSMFIPRSVRHPALSLRASLSGQVRKMHS